MYGKSSKFFLKSQFIIYQIFPLTYPEQERGRSQGFFLPKTDKQRIFAMIL